MSQVPRGQAAARRAIGTLAVAMAAMGMTPAASASAVLPAGGPPPSPAAGPAATRQLHFGVRLVDVPVDELHNPRALLYIIDFPPAGAACPRPERPAEARQRHGQPQRDRARNSPRRTPPAAARSPVRDPVISSR